jgi:hypothetical protein
MSGQPGFKGFEFDLQLRPKYSTTATPEARYRPTVAFDEQMTGTEYESTGGSNKVDMMDQDMTDGEEEESDSMVGSEDHDADTEHETSTKTATMSTTLKTVTDKL